MITPWLSIWGKPRDTIRGLASTNPKKGFLWLSIIYGFPSLLRIFQDVSLGAHINFWWILLISVVCALPVGWILLHYMSAVTFLMGKLIKGAASYNEIRASVSWAIIPNIGPLAMWIIMLCVFGQHLFFADFSRQLFAGPEFGYLIAMVATLLVASIWWLIILLQALSEVQKFSCWMALLNLILAGIVYFLVALGIGAIVSQFMLQ